jgi:gamma-glutamyl:cysteine ligase YbdK (ATP-grasp superfamily)
VRETLKTLVTECRPHALALGCADALDGVQRLADASGADRQRAFVAGNGPVENLLATLADLFGQSEWHHVADGDLNVDPTNSTTERSG